MELEEVFPNNKDKNNILISLNNIHFLNFSFQMCPSSSPEKIQVLRNRVLGCNSSGKCIFETKYFNQPFQKGGFEKDEVWLECYFFKFMILQLMQNRHGNHLRLHNLENCDTESETSIFFPYSCITMINPPPPPPNLAANLTQ